MNALVALAISVLALLGAPGSAASPDMAPGVMIVCPGAPGRGQAAPIGPVTAVTAAHMKCDGGEWIDNAGVRGKVHSWTVISPSDKFDLAIIHLGLMAETRITPEGVQEIAPPHFSTWYRRARSLPKPGDPVFWRAYVPAKGAPLRTFVSGGTFIEVDKEDDQLMAYGGYLQPGVSGGAMVNAEGELVGIMASAYFFTPQPNTYVPFTPQWGAVVVVGKELK